MLFFSTEEKPGCQTSTIFSATAEWIFWEESSCFSPAAIQQHRTRSNITNRHSESEAQKHFETHERVFHCKLWYSSKEILQWQREGYYSCSTLKDVIQSFWKLTEMQFWRENDHFVFIGVDYLALPLLKCELNRCFISF